MKILSVSSVCFVGALILALFVTWSAAAPRQISGDREVTGCNRCDGTTGAHCPPRGDKICSKSRIICIESSSGRDCIKNAWICGGTNCLPAQMELCI